MKKYFMLLTSTLFTITTAMASSDVDIITNEDQAEMSIKGTCYIGNTCSYKIPGRKLYAVAFSPIQRGMRYFCSFTHDSSRKAIDIRGAHHYPAGARVSFTGAILPINASIDATDLVQSSDHFMQSFWNSTGNVVELTVNCNRI